MKAPKIDWWKSSFSQGNGNCVEVGVWRKSTASASNGSCVEVMGGRDDDVFIRESDDAGIVVRTSRAKWQAFINGVKAGEFDL